MANNAGGIADTSPSLYYNINFITDASLIDSSIYSQCLDIYAPFVTDTAVTFDVAVPTADAFKARMESQLQQFPVIVLTQSNCNNPASGQSLEVLGYAAANTNRDRAAYQWNVETAIYMAPAARGLGLGTKLYQQLFSILTKLGYYNAYALITEGNKASLALHAHCGFLPLATYMHTGYKLGKWHSVAWLQKQLQLTYTDGASPILPTRMQQLDANQRALMLAPL